MTYHIATSNKGHWASKYGPVCFFHSLKQPSAVDYDVTFFASEPHHNKLNAVTLFVRLYEYTLNARRMNLKQTLKNGRICSRDVNNQEKGSGSSEHDFDGEHKII